MLKKRFVFILVFVLSHLGIADSGVGLSVEIGPVFDTRNEARIPGDSGTLVNLKASSGTLVTWAGVRIYASYRFAPQHELRALYAPLSAKGSLRNSEPISFQEEDFAANSELNTFYKFNSYRLTYAYHFRSNSPWSFALGFTAKIRDAEIRLSQDSVSASKPNIGFVPLLHAQARRVINENWSFVGDLDGLAAPQGRAVDLSLHAERYLALFGGGHVLYAFIGYRTVEGGADNDEVYNFAWFNSAVLGLRAAF